ncbi:MAG: SpoIID/LytB domain-containing protein [Bdellovibrionales bacterium]|nr:SpoIID/LytB domain-containing protein [Bdellovibrionales bacterium]
MLLLGVLLFLGNAQAMVYEPVFNLPDARFGTVPFQNIVQFRVLVFPHMGAYSIPQGREASAASVKITSSQPCDVYAALLDADDNWVKSGDKITSLSEISLSSAKLSKFHKEMKLAASDVDTFYYSCPAPFKVNRAKPLTSFEYSGDFVAYVQKGTVQIVNIVDPDTYLKGVIPSEVPSGWPAEVLKAQAIAARTYAWWSVKAARVKPANYDMDDTVSYQAYSGISSRKADTDAASDATAGLIMKFAGKPIKAYFSADAGGYTESAKNYFDTELPYCIAKKEMYNLATLNKPTAWTASFTIATLQSKLVGTLLPHGVKISSIKVSEKSESGRAVKLAVTAATKKVYTVSGPDFRYQTKLRSTLFDIAVTGTTYKFNGRGYGHGVGMAQIGAMEHDKQLGWTYDQILNFYYDDVTIERQ